MGKTTKQSQSAAAKRQRRIDTQGSRSVKRQRRTNTQMAAMDKAIADALAADAPMTVRQMFYRLVTLDLVPKTEQGYRHVVGALIRLRESGSVDFEDIVDSTRFARKPVSYSSLDDALSNAMLGYRRAIWDDQPVYVEVWLEKDALAGVLETITDQWDVPLMVVRGYSSITFLHDAAETIDAQGKPVYIYYFGDHDPSGKDIPRDVEDKLTTYAPSAEIHFTVAAVTPAQIGQWHLPSRPTKKSDVRSRSFKGQSTEVDAIPPARLRTLVEKCITQHIDQTALDDTRAAEAKDTSELSALLRRSQRRRK